MLTSTLGVRWSGRVSPANLVTCLSRRLVEPLLQRTLKHCAQADHCSHVTLV